MQMASTYRGRSTGLGALLVLLGCVCGLLALVPVGAAAKAGAGKGVAVDAETSGSSLIVTLRGAPKSRCSLALGSGDDAIELPGTRIRGNGRAKVRWDLTSDVPTGDQPVFATCSHAGAQSSDRAFVSISLVAANGVLATVLNIALDILLGGSLLLFLVLLIEMVVREPEPRERLMRSLALICGAIVALGAQATGVDFASYIVEALTGARPGGFFFKFLSVILPGGIAAAFGWYFTHVMSRSEMMGLRMVSFLGMLTVIAFMVIFAEATNTEGVFLGAAAIPNASFVVGLIFGVLVFTPPADADPSERTGLGILADLVDRLASGRGGSPATGDRAPAAERRSPFADD